MVDLTIPKLNQCYSLMCLNECMNNVDRYTILEAYDVMSAYIVDGVLSRQVDLASRGHGSAWAYVVVCFIIAGLAFCDGTAQGALLGDLSYMNPIYVQVIYLSIFYSFFHFLTLFVKVYQILKHNILVLEGRSLCQCRMPCPTDTNM